MVHLGVSPKRARPVSDVTPVSEHCDECGKLFWHNPPVADGVFCSIACAIRFELTVTGQVGTVVDEEGVDQ